MQEVTLSREDLLVALQRQAERADRLQFANDHLRSVLHDRDLRCTSFDDLYIALTNHLRQRNTELCPVSHFYVEIDDATYPLTDDLCHLIEQLWMGRIDRAAIDFGGREATMFLHEHTLSNGKPMVVINQEDTTICVQENTGLKRVKNVMEHRAKDFMFVDQTTVQRLLSALPGDEIVYRFECPLMLDMLRAWSNYANWRVSRLQDAHNLRRALTMISDSGGYVSLCLNGSDPGLLYLVVHRNVMDEVQSLVNIGVATAIKLES
jgi:hypothetical protein